MDARAARDADQHARADAVVTARVRAPHNVRLDAELTAQARVLLAAAVVAILAALLAPVAVPDVRGAHHVLDLVRTDVTIRAPETAELGAPVLVMMHALQTANPIALGDAIPHAQAVVKAAVARMDVSVATLIARTLAQDAIPHALVCAVKAVANRYAKVVNARADAPGIAKETVLAIVMVAVVTTALVNVKAAAMAALRTVAGDVRRLALQAVENATVAVPKLAGLRAGIAQELAPLLAEAVAQIRVDLTVQETVVLDARAVKDVKDVAELAEVFVETLVQRIALLRAEPDVTAHALAAARNAQTLV